MFEPSPSEIRAVIANFRAVEQACKEFNVTVTELEKELERQTHLEQTLHSGAARSIVCSIVNRRNLDQAACETNMPAPVYQDLLASIENATAANTSHRDLRVYSSKEFAQRGHIGSQGKLFDEPELSGMQAPGHVVRDDGGNYPFG